MHWAEKLYLAGLVSYPRTETTKYARGFDLSGTLGALSNADWLPEARELLDGAGGSGEDDGREACLHARARSDGEDVGDHPPLTPVKLATPKACGGAEAWELYQVSGT